MRSLMKNYRRNNRHMHLSSISGLTVSDQAAGPGKRINAIVAFSRCDIEGSAKDHWPILGRPRLLPVWPVRVP